MQPVSDRELSEECRMRSGKSVNWEGFNNSDGTINTRHEVFQMGRLLFDAQALIADIDAGRCIDQAKVRGVLHHLCHLVSAVGQLRAEYAGEREKFKGLKAILAKLVETT